MLGPLVLFAIAMCGTPGPNVVLATAMAATFGLRRTLPQIAGVTAGFGAQIVLAGLGLAGLFASDPRLQTALKYLGAAYLLYLAWRIATADGGGKGATGGRPLGLRDGVVITWLNPKGWVTTIGALSAFTTPQGNRVLEVGIIAVVLAVACGLSLLLWAGFGAAIARWLGRPARRRAVNLAMAALLVLSLVPVLL